MPPYTSRVSIDASAKLPMGGVTPARSRSLAPQGPASWYRLSQLLLRRGYHQMILPIRLLLLAVVASSTVLVAVAPQICSTWSAVLYSLCRNGCICLYCMHVLIAFACAGTVSHSYLVMDHSESSLPHLYLTAELSRASECWGTRPTPMMKGQGHADSA